MSLDEKFWSYVNIREPDDCWPWVRGKTSKGYGEFCPPKHYGMMKVVYAHRYAWSSRNGAIPSGNQICHKCDNPSCCNPSHLFCGSNMDNVRDKMRKGRQPRGEQVANSKVGPRDVLEIRERYAVGHVYQKELAAEFGVSRPTITEIVTGKTWAHIGGPRTHRNLLQ